MVQGPLASGFMVKPRSTMALSPLRLGASSAAVAPANFSSPSALPSKTCSYARPAYQSKV